MNRPQQKPPLKRRSAEAHKARIKHKRDVMRSYDCVHYNKPISKYMPHQGGGQYIEPRDRHGKRQFTQAVLDFRDRLAGKRA